MQKVVAALQAQCNLSSKSCLVDVGAGLGRSRPPKAASVMRLQAQSSFGYR